SCILCLVGILGVASASRFHGMEVKEFWSSAPFIEVIGEGFHFHLFRIRDSEDAKTRSKTMSVLEELGIVTDINP
ncbi:hypothetical protein MKW98_027813, partial [Papaver atlanticum]